ncbi:DNA polymerase III subunit Tau [Bordetella bronchiseptica Bbr77]|nr:DNA polymerase III subunit Tau [Bordetella bronchiseptica Bbr77]
MYRDPGGSHHSWLRRPFCIPAGAFARRSVNQRAVPGARNWLYNPPMTYLVLARKWRPRSFDTLIGQDHVVRALTHALDTQRLHHAWLFTGTRGVGKTTLSRILAKSLNCENGITSKPCGQCRACTEIDAGRFVDYLELDAASNRGVEEMTQLLEQAVYAPGAGRFKVYMIDEVHMLTGHAFNAMLKTLEEPPPHVKFILATTDPQKIPVTVLSRCLQFNLKQMPPDAIVGHLQAVLGEEQIGFEVPALRLIGQAAGGSMRDALSLTDQAIAYSAGNLSEEAVRGMLGTIDQRHLVRLLDALASGDAAGVLAVADELAVRGLSYAGALADLAVLLSRVAIEQRVRGALPQDDPLTEDITRLAAALHPDAVQLFYSVAVHSRGELTLSPDEYAGFVMACLRMLALNGEAGPATAVQAPRADTTPRAAAPAAAAPAETRPEPTPAPALAPQAAAAPRAVARSESKPQPAPEPEPEPEPAPRPAATPVAATPPAVAEPEPVAAPVVQARAAEPAPVPPWEDLPEAVAAAPAPAQPAAAPAPVAANDDGPPAWVDEAIPDEAGGGFVSFTADPDDEFETLAPAAAAMPAPRAPTPRRESGGRGRAARSRLADMSPTGWPELAARLPVTGLAAELARQSEWAGVQGDAVLLRVAVRTLAESESRVRLQTVLCEHFGQGLRLEIEVGVTGDGTAHAVAQIERAARQQAAEDAVAVDPFVQALVADFGGRVVPGSIRHVDNPPAA